MNAISNSVKATLTLFVLAMGATSAAHAQYIDNTPFDPRTWLPRPSPPPPSYITDPESITGRWEYADGYFVSDGRGNWVEHRYRGPQSHFREVGRGSGFVDLYDSSRQIIVRLTNGQGLWRPQNGGSFGLWGTGTFR